MTTFVHSLPRLTEISKFFSLLKHLRTKKKKIYIYIVIYAIYVCVYIYIYTHIHKWGQISL